MIIFICFLIALAISGIIMMVIRSSLKSVREERTACNYVRNNSLKITNQSDTFSHENITTTPRAQQNTSTSSPKSGSSSSARPASTSRSTTSKPISSTKSTTRRR